MTLESRVDICGHGFKVELFRRVIDLSLTFCVVLGVGTGQAENRI